MDFDEPEAPLPTTEDVIKACKSIALDLKRFSSLTEKDTNEKNRIFSSIEKKIDEITKMTEIPNFGNTFFDSELYPYFHILVAIPNRKISSSFLSILCDISEDPNCVDRVIRENIIEFALKSCEILDEVNNQSDAQFLYSTFELISIIIDGCEDPKQVVDGLMKNTNILKLITKEFEREDFDENVLSASELLAILLQISPQLIKEVDIKLVNLVINFCANMRKTAQAAEDEAASNAFNIVTLLAMDDSGSQKLLEVKAMEILLACMESTGSKTEKSSAKLAFNAIEACLSGSEKFCEQFVDLGGLRKVFGFMNDAGLPTKHSLSSNVVSVIDSMLTQLPLESTQIQRVIRKFSEKECAKVNMLIAIAEIMFKESKFDDDGSVSADDDSFDSFCLACASLTELVCYAPKEVKIAVIQGINESQILDSSLVIDGATRRAELAESIKERVMSGVKVYASVVDSKK